MFEILDKVYLNETYLRLTIDAPHIARKAQAGQFIILIPMEGGERIPLTIAGADVDGGSIDIIFQVVGKTTSILSSMGTGDHLADIVGPLGNPTPIYDGYQNVIVVSGGAGAAIALPEARALKKEGARVTVIAGFRRKDLVIHDAEFSSCADEFIRISDDGSWGEKGVVTTPLERLLNREEIFDLVLTIGSLRMMRSVSTLTERYGIKTLCSLNPIMIDGLGQCGCCRVSIGGKMRFACIDGPDFDAHDVDFDSLYERNRMYRSWENERYEEYLLSRNEEVLPDGR